MLYLSMYYQFCYVVTWLLRSKPLTININLSSRPHESSAFKSFYNHKKNAIFSPISIEII